MDSAGMSGGKGTHQRSVLESELAESFSCQRGTRKGTYASDVPSVDEDQND